MKQRKKAHAFINNMEAKINNLIEQVSDLNKIKNEHFFTDINKLIYCLFDLKLFFQKTQKLNDHKYSSENQKIITNQNENRQNPNIDCTLSLKLNGRCWNCEEDGHKAYQCPYPFKKCPMCNHIGHNSPSECRMYWMAKSMKPITRTRSYPLTATLTIYNVFGRNTEFGINMDYIPQHLNLESVFKTIGLKYFWIINLKNRNADKKIFDNSFNIQLYPGDHIVVVRKHDIRSRVRG
eukprot:UN10397